MRRISLCAAAVAVALTLGTAKADKLGDIDIGQPWARASAGAAKSSAAFFTLRNGGATPDRLTAASTPAAAKAELHTHKKDGDVMRLVAVPAIDLPPGKEVKLAPGSFHIMLMGLKAPLHQGDRFPLTLTFEKAGTVTVEVPVEAITSTGSHGSGMPGGGMPGGHMH